MRLKIIRIDTYAKVRRLVVKMLPLEIHIDVKKDAYLLVMFICYTTFLLFTLYVIGLKPLNHPKHIRPKKITKVMKSATTEKMVIPCTSSAIGKSKGECTIR